MFCILCFAATIPLSAVIAEKGRRRLAIFVSLSIAVFGVVLAPLFEAGTIGAIMFVVLGMSLIGMVYGPLGTLLSEMFPTQVRYSGTSLTFNLAGIVGASLAPYIAMRLATDFGLRYVGLYLALAALLTVTGLLFVRETSGDSL